MAVSAKDGADGSTARTWNVSDAGHEDGKPRVNSNEERERREVGGLEHLQVLCLESSAFHLVVSRFGWDDSRNGYGVIL